MKNSPLSKVVPQNLPNIPGVTHPINSNAPNENDRIIEEPIAEVVPGLNCDFDPS